MNVPTRTGRAKLLFAAILTGVVVAAGMAPALATGLTRAEDSLKGVEVSPAASPQVLVAVEGALALLPDLSGIDDGGGGKTEGD